MGTIWNSLDKTVTLKVDTGTDKNVMNEWAYMQKPIQGVQLKPHSIILESFGNTDVEAIGKFTSFLHCKGKVYRTVFHVTTANNRPNLLSMENAILLGLIKPCFTIQSMTTGSRIVLLESPAPRPRNLFQQGSRIVLLVPKALHSRRKLTQDSLL